MGDIKKIMEEELAKEHKAKHKTKVPSHAVPPSPERKKKGKTQWNKLPLEDAGKGGQQQNQTNSTKTSQSRKGERYQNNSMWNASGPKLAHNNKVNLAGNEKATKPWGAGGSQSKTGRPMVALNIKGNVDKSGKGTYLTAANNVGHPNHSNNSNKEIPKKTSSQSDKSSHPHHSSHNNSSLYKNKNSTKQTHQQNNNAKSHFKSQQTKQLESNKNSTANSKTVSVHARPYQPPGQSQVYGQETQSFDYQNSYTSYGTYNQMGYDGYYVPPPSLEETAAYARSQIEYYFTTENLLRDMFLRSQFDEAGYVPVSLLANFRAVYSVHQDYESLVASLAQSTVLELDIENEVVRLRDGWKHWLIPNGVGGFGQPRYAKSVVEAGMDAIKGAPEFVEEPQKETEPLDVESGSASSSDSETVDAIPPQPQQHLAAH